MKNHEASVGICSLQTAQWVLAVLATLLLLFVTASAARAQTFQYSASWNGGSSNWNNSSNWTCNAGNGPFGCSPGDFTTVSGTLIFDVTIAGSSGNVVTFDANPTTVDSLTLSSGQTLQSNTNGNSSFLTIGDSNSNSSNSGTLANGGTLLWNNGSLFTIGTSGGSNAKITNTGTISLSDSTMQVNGSFGQNSGTLNIGNSSEGVITGTLTNTSTGTINVTGDSALFTGALNTGGTMLVTSGSDLNVSGIYTQTSGITTVQQGATVSAQAYDVVGGALNVQGQQLTETPSSGTTSVGGTLELNDGGSLTINGSFVVSGSVATGTGGGSLNVSNGLALDGGTLSLGANGTMTAGSLASSGGTLLLTGSSTVTDSGNLTNSGPLVVSGAGNVNVDGSITNSGSEDLACEYNTVACGFITMQTVQGEINSGNVGMAIIDSLELFGQGLAPSDGGELGAPVDPPLGSGTSNPGANFDNLSGGSVRLTAAADYVIATGSFNNDAGSSLTIKGGNDRLIAAAVVNGGAVTLSGKNDGIVTSSFTNTGTVSIGAGEFIAIKTLDLGTVVGTVNATSYSQSAGSTKVNGTLYSPAVNISGGVLSGTGLIASLPSSLGGPPNPTVVTVAGGTVIPGSGRGLGTLTINGSYVQDANASLLIDIDGTGSGEVSMLDVLGAASLDGTVKFDFGFTPVAGDSFTFLTADAGELSGAFSSDSFGGLNCPYCQLDYNDAAGTVTLDVVGSTTSVPEPATLLLLGTGLLGLAISLKKRGRWGSG